MVLYVWNINNTLLMLLKTLNRHFEIKGTFLTIVLADRLRDFVQLSV